MGKAEPMVLQVAEGFVVVMKSEPLKAGDSMEDKNSDEWMHSVIQPIS